MVIPIEIRKGVETWIEGDWICSMCVAFMCKRLSLNPHLKHTVSTLWWFEREEPPK